jgi:hypothetical protein
MLFASSHGVASSLLPLLSQVLESSDRVIQCCCRFGLLSSAHASYGKQRVRLVCLFHTSHILVFSWCFSLLGVSLSWYLYSGVQATGRGSKQ